MKHRWIAAAAIVAGCGGARTASRAEEPADRWVEGGAGALRVTVRGAGEPTIVMVHGLAHGRDGWAAQVAHLEGTHRVVVYDQRGHGESEPARDGVYTMEALADDLERVRLAVGVETFVLVGHSMSGAVLSTYAGKHPDALLGLVFVDAVGDFSAFPAEEVQPYADKAIAATDAATRRAEFADDLAKAQPATRASVNAGLDRIDDRAFVELSRAMFAVRDAKARIAPYTGPMIAIEAQGNELPINASAVFGIRRVELAGVSHWLHLDDPAAFNRALDEFLAAL